MTTEKKLFNRYDQFEIASFFTENAEDLVEKKWKKRRAKFIIKCILGTLLFISGYLSHWGPWPWPSNYYFLIFSIIFYHIGSYIYGQQSPVKNHEGNTIGQFWVNGKAVTVVLRIGQNKHVYTLQSLFENKDIVSKAMNYYEFFTESGHFLINKYQLVVADLIKETEKVLS